MRSSLISKLTCLLVLLLPLAAVIYFDFGKIRPNDILVTALPPSTDVVPVAPDVAQPAPPPQPTPSLSEVEQFLTEFGAQLRKLPQGRIVLFAPKAMKVSDKREVEARVGFGVEHAKRIQRGESRLLVDGHGRGDPAACPPQDRGSELRPDMGLSARPHEPISR